jgi:EAL domain-containing protein (putative c-di-GMP-specific phosphodiesterase class I)
MKELLEPAFQPIAELATGAIEYYEALARIRDDPVDSGHVTLIELAERHQFIHLLDLAILDQAAEAAAREKQRIAVNFSVITIEARYRQVVARLARLGDACRGMVVEITETAPIHDPQKVALFIAAVREFGCRVALDDYGNTDGHGHFTANLVRFLRPDFLKLDGSILARATSSGDHHALQQAISLAESVDAEVIAEFVDSAEKIELLTLLGVRYGQGWAIGRPTRNTFVPATEQYGATLIS